MPRMQVLVKLHELPHIGASGEVKNLGDFSKLLSKVQKQITAASRIFPQVATAKVVGVKYGEDSDGARKSRDESESSRVAAA